MEQYKIFPLHLGTVYKADPSRPDGVLALPTISYLIKARGAHVLVDTGTCDAPWAEKYHHKLALPDEMRIENRLKQLGVEPDDIEILVCSHLHWDHVYNNNLFQKARIYIQKKELEYAISPLPWHYVVYEAFQMGLTPRWIHSAGQFEIIDGDHELMPGLKIMFLPGHTPGSQGVLVSTAKGDYLVAMDSVLTMEDWNTRQYGMPRKPDIYCDLRDCYRTYCKIMKIADFILPGHDFCAFDKSVYP